MKRIAVFLTLLAALGCRQGGRIAAGTPIVLISVDTLRSDRLPCYGYHAGETPAIDALARDSILFESAYAHVPLTLPSHVSILTGLLPGEHGVRDNLGYDLDAEHFPLLQNSLKQLGYATGAAVSAYVLRGDTGLSAGFDWYEDGIEISRQTSLAGLWRAGGETLRLAVDWVGTVRDRPFFLFFHIYEPHAPYAPPAPFAGRLASPYDGEVAAADEVVGKLLEELRRLDLYDRAVVVFLSDHGEGLGDHDEAEHGVFLYRSTLQVPLLLKLPHGERAGTRVSETAQLIDVYPTILELLDVPGPDGLEGQSLLALSDSDGSSRSTYAETFYPRLHYGFSDLASLIRGRYHYIRAPEPELYDLVADRDESRNILAGQQVLGDDLRQVLERHDRPLEDPSPVDQETLRKLAALGYVGTTAALVGGDLPDPKSRREALSRIREAFRLYSEGDRAQAIPALRKVVADNPLMVDGWEALARSLEADGRAAAAIEAYGEALRVSGGAPVLALPAAALFLRTGDLEQARSHAVIAMKADPVAAREVLAQVALRQRRLDEAERWAREAVAKRRTRITPLIVLAEVLAAQARPEEALEWIDTAAAEFASKQHKDASVVRGLHFLRGKVLASQGAAEQAEQAFLAEIEIFPDQQAAYTHLAVLYGIVGNTGAARETIERMLRVSPTPAAYAEGVKTLRVLRDDEGAARLDRIAIKRFGRESRP